MHDLPDKILTTQAARRMLKMVSPIYQNSYIGLWVMEVIAREYDGARALIESLPLQFRVESCTWSIGMWERRYGVESAGSDLEQRRTNVILKRDARAPMNPRKLELLCDRITGGQSQVQEGSGPYTVRAYIATRDPGRVNLLASMIGQVKPAHISVELINLTMTRGQAYGGLVLRRQKRYVYKEAII